MADGIRGSNLPLAELTHVFGLEEIAPGTYRTSKQRIEDFVQFLLGLAGLDPSVVAELSAKLTDEIAARVAGDTALGLRIDAIVGLAKADLDRIVRGAGLVAALAVSNTSIDYAGDGQRQQVLADRQPTAERVWTELGRLIRETDTIQGRVTHYLPQMIPTLLRGSEDGTTVEEITARAIFALVADLRWMSERTGRELFALDPVAELVSLFLREDNAGTPGALWRSPTGEVRVQPAPVTWATGRDRYLGSFSPAPTVTVLPRIILAENDVPRRTRVFQGIPSGQWVGGRYWSMYYGDHLTAGEGYGNFCILRFSDDIGTVGADAATWTEVAYWVIDDPKARLLDPQLWCDPDGNLHAFTAVCGVSDDGGQNDLRFGCYNLVIPEAHTGKPRFGRPVRLSTYGVATRPWIADGKWYLALDLRESTAGPLYPTYAGTTICEWDWRNRQLFPVGRLPFVDNAILSFPEGSGGQLRDGSLIYVRRTASGQVVTRSPSGNPAGPWTTPAVWTALGQPGPNSRARIVVTRLGNLIVAWNDTPAGTSGTAARANLTLGISVNGGQSLLRKVVLDPSGAVSYPDLTLDPFSDRITATWDRDRTGEKAILGAHLSETALLQGTVPSPPIFVVDRQGSAP